MNRILFKNFRGGYNMLCIKVSFIRIAKAKKTKYKEKPDFFLTFPTFIVFLISREYEFE